MPTVLLLDVNETLLDLRAIDPHFKRLFGAEQVRQDWFKQFIESAFVTVITGNYVPFGQIAMAALEMIANKNNVSLTDDDRKSIRESMVQLPAHPDVRESLKKLRDAGFRLAALTNSTAQVAEKQLEYSGLRDLLEQALSADTVRRLKPAPEPYHMAAKSMGVEISQTRLIAAHAWDIAGALNAGCKAAFVARPGKVLDPLGPQPDIVGKDFREIAEQILSREA